MGRQLPIPGADYYGHTHCRYYCEAYMTKTEQLLREAAAIATTVIPNPSEEAVISVFHRLCCEIEDQEELALESAPSNTEHTLH